MLKTRKEIQTGYKCYLTITERNIITRLICKELKFYKGKKGPNVRKRCLGKICRKQEELFPDEDRIGFLQTFKRRLGLT